MQQENISNDPRKNWTDTMMIGTIPYMERTDNQLKLVDFTIKKILEKKSGYETFSRNVTDSNLMKKEWDNNNNALFRMGLGGVKDIGDATQFPVGNDFYFTFAGKRIPKEFNADNKIVSDDLRDRRDGTRYQDRLKDFRIKIQDERHKQNKDLN